MDPERRVHDFIDLDERHLPAWRNAKAKSRGVKMARRGLGPGTARAGRRRAGGVFPLVALLLLPVGLGACSMVGGGVRPATPSAMPVPVTAERPRMHGMPEGPSDYGRSSGEAGAHRIALGVVDVALESIGRPYRWGGTGVNGFDCSGLIQFAYGSFGIRLPRVSSDQIRTGSAVDPVLPRLRPGDILGFADRRGGETSHIGLYIGGDEFIHSSSDGVTISTLRNPYWQSHLVAARRIVE